MHDSFTKCINTKLARKHNTKLLLRLLGPYAHSSQALMQSLHILIKQVAENNVPMPENYEGNFTEVGTEIQPAKAFYLLKK